MDKDRHYRALEAELFRERASGLGIAGSRLQKAIVEYELCLSSNNPTDGRVAALLKVVADRAYDLLLQRELNGLLHENFKWLIKSYRIPEAVVRQLCESTEPE